MVTGVSNHSGLLSAGAEIYNTYMLTARTTRIQVKAIGGFTKQASQSLISPSALASIPRLGTVASEVHTYAVR